MYLRIFFKIFKEAYCALIYMKNGLIFLIKDFRAKQKSIQR